MNPQEFTEAPRLPVTDYSELSDLHQSLLESLLLISQSDITDPNNKNIMNSVYWLARLILESYPREVLAD